MSDSRVHIKAQDGVSPVIDGISSKLTIIGLNILTGITVETGDCELNYM